MNRTQHLTIFKCGKHHLLLERLHTELSRSMSDFSVDFLAISIAMFRSSIHFPISKRVLQDQQCEWWPAQPGAFTTIQSLGTSLKGPFENVDFTRDWMNSHHKEHTSVVTMALLDLSRKAVNSLSNFFPCKAGHARLQDQSAGGTQADSRPSWSSWWPFWL